MVSAMAILRANYPRRASHIYKEAKRSSRKSTNMPPAQAKFQCGEVFYNSFYNRSYSSECFPSNEHNESLGDCATGENSSGGSNLAKELSYRKETIDGIRNEMDFVLPTTFASL